MQTQLELTDRIIALARSVPGTGIELAIALQQKVHNTLQVLPYNDETKAHEHAIRWRRTADQIFSDGFVYEGKACTDYVIAYLALANARDIETQFVKVQGELGVHSIAEINLGEEWFIHDVALAQTPFKGQYKEGISINGWTLWKKGRDAWDLGLSQYSDIRKIR